MGLIAAAATLAAAPPARPARMELPVIQSEFIYASASFASAHASTIADTPSGLVAAWFGGTSEGQKDVEIYLSRHVHGRWTVPVSVADGVQPDGSRHPCWNPVLYRTGDGVLHLAYKVGPDPRTWWGLVRTSTDDGRTWRAAVRLPDGILGPIKNKAIELPDGLVIAPTSTESPERPSHWRVHFELSRDRGRTWTTAAPAPQPAGTPEPDAIQPSVLIHPGGRLQAIGRTRSGRVFETWSRDRGATWTPLSLLALPNPNSGTDAVTLRDGRHLLVYNHTASARTPLNVAVSDDGRRWQAAAILETEPGEYSYPAVIQARDGKVHITYTWHRERVRHVVLDPGKIRPIPIVDGVWPEGVAR